MFQTLPTAPPDSILGLTDVYNKDPRPEKMNLTVGVYKDEEGRTPILESVKLAETHLLAEEKTKGYLGIEGHPEYLAAVSQLALGDIVDLDRVASVQTPGGTGALRVGAEMIGTHFPGTRIWVSNPTWANHNSIFSAAKLKVETYPYLAEDKTSFDLAQMVDYLNKEGRRGDFVCLHACCHNPTGIDPNESQWNSISDVIAEKGMIPLIDYAYQGFGEGLREDSLGIRILLASSPEAIVCSSYSKNFGLYSERVGAVMFINGTPAETSATLSQVKQTVRSNYSNPPRHGAATVARILCDASLRQLWESEVKGMRGRITEMRNEFVSGMKKVAPKRDFTFLLSQKGMFSYTGLTAMQADWLKTERAIYLVGTGRINVAGISPKHIDRLCRSIAECLDATAT